MLVLIDAAASVLIALSISLVKLDYTRMSYLILASMLITLSISLVKLDYTRMSCLMLFLNSTS